MAADALISDLLKGWRFLYRRGFIEGFGHISARLPGGTQFLIARHSLGPNADPDDFILMDFDGKKISGRGDPPGEFPIHLEILKARPDVGSIIHYHGMYSTAFTTSGRTLKPIHLMGTLFNDGIPTYPDPRLVMNAERGVMLAKTLGSHRAVLMRAHGAAITGDNVQEAVSGAFLFEQNAERACISASLGDPVWLDEQTAAGCAAEVISSRAAYRRVWALVESDDQQFQTERR